MCWRHRVISWSESTSKDGRTGARITKVIRKIHVPFGELAYALLHDLVVELGIPFFDVHRLRGGCRGGEYLVDFLNIGTVLLCSALRVC